MRKYGENIPYKFELLKAEDNENLQLFHCGNEVLDNHIQHSVINNDNIIDTDGLYFKITDLYNGNLKILLPFS